MRSLVDTIINLESFRKLKETEKGDENFLHIWIIFVCLVFWRVKSLHVSYFRYVSGGGWDY